MRIGLEGVEKDLKKIGRHSMKRKKMKQKKFEKALMKSIGNENVFASNQALKAKITELEYEKDLLCKKIEDLKDSLEIAKQMNRFFNRIGHDDFTVEKRREAVKKISDLAFFPDSGKENFFEQNAKKLFEIVLNETAVRYTGGKPTVEFDIALKKLNTAKIRPEALEEFAAGLDPHSLSELQASIKEFKTFSENVRAGIISTLGLSLINRIPYLC